MSFTKLLDLLFRRALYFSNLLSLRAGDPFEGTLTTFTRRALEAAALRPEALAGLRTVIAASEDIPSDDAIRAMAATMIFVNQRQAHEYYVNCWHQNEHESAALWRLYAEVHDGVAIRCTFAAVCESLQSEAALFAGPVQYRDYSKDATDLGNGFIPVVTKRRSFEHEREIRFVYWEPDPTTVPSAVTHIPGGVLISCDIERLIGEVLISPYAPGWAAEAMSSTIRALGCAAPVRKSSLLSID